MRAPTRISASGLQAYWTASKCRLDRWARALKGSDPSRRAPGPTWHGSRGIRTGLLEEILTSEILTRVWTGVVRGFDHHHRCQDGEPYVRSVLTGHMEARHKTLKVLVASANVGHTDVVQLNRLRRRVECWTDMLLASLMSIHDVSGLAFNPMRVKDFAEGYQSRRRQRLGQCTWPLVFSSVRSAFVSSLSLSSPNCDLNEKIASSVLACFGPDLFDSTGQFQSVWQLRLANAAADTQGLIEQLLLEMPNDCGSAGRVSPPSTRMGRLKKRR